MTLCRALAFAFIAIGMTVASTPRTLPPELPETFVADFIEFTAPMAGSPPYENGQPPPPFYGTRGITYYDWTHRRMIEVRKDFCVNIFGFSNLFPCTFHNVNGSSYLYSENTTNLPPCCLFASPFYPPPPGFLRHNVNASLRDHAPWNGAPADWWIVPDIAPPTGPFWYAYRNERSPQVYLSFSFPGMQGWVQQNFVHVRPNVKIDNSIFDLPPQCLPVDTLPNCGFFSANRQATGPLWSTGIALEPQGE